jgi:hypothetical protein
VFLELGGSVGRRRCKSEYGGLDDVGRNLDRRLIGDHARWRLVEWNDHRGFRRLGRRRHASQPERRAIRRRLERCQRRRELGQRRHARRWCGNRRRELKLWWLHERRLGWQRR